MCNILPIQTSKQHFNIARDTRPNTEVCLLFAGSHIPERKHVIDPTSFVQKILIPVTEQQCRLIAI